MNQYIVYLRGRQIDTFVERDNASAIEWVCAYYPENEFGDVMLTLYRWHADTQSKTHVATIPVTGM